MGIWLGRAYQIRKEMSRSVADSLSGFSSSPILLAIEASGSACSVALSVGECSFSREDSTAHDHSAVLTLQIESVLREAGIAMHAVQAIAVSEGPGSYTSLRIGFATAKGLAYAIGCPVVAVPTLESLAYIMVQRGAAMASRAILMPMIDARRMEVYTQPYDISLQPLAAPSARIFDAATQPFFSRNSPAFFGGPGAEKGGEYLAAIGYTFIHDVRTSAEALLPLAQKRYKREAFASVAYMEPLYLKEFEAIPSKKTI